MAHTRRVIKDRDAVGDDIFILTDLGGGRVRLIPDPTSVTEVGTTIDADLLQPIEDDLMIAVDNTRRVDVGGNGLTGGGPLSSDITISLNPVPVVAGVSTSAMSAIPPHLEGSVVSGSAHVVSTRIVPFIQGELRIGFYLALNAEGDTAYAQIYRDTSPVGTLRTRSVTGEPAYFEEDISGWFVGDRLSIQLSSQNATVSEVTAKYDIVR